MNIEEKAIEIAKREVLKKLAEEEPYLFSVPHGLYHRIKQLQNGQLQLVLRVKNGFVTDVVETEVKRIVFKKNGTSSIDNSSSDQ